MLVIVTNVEASNNLCSLCSVTQAGNAFETVLPYRLPSSPIPLPSLKSFYLSALMDSSPSYIFGTQGFGSSWKLEDVFEVIHYLDNHGIRQFDTAAIYPVSSPGASEVLLGQESLPGAVIDTKILFSGGGMLAKGNMESSITASLMRLNFKKVSKAGKDA